MLHGNPAFLVFIGKDNLTEDLIVGGIKTGLLHVIPVEDQRSNPLRSS